uniref:MATH domain-containing protein n=1 Tax=Romanomermis culicivorax TaxID=13658 RepID=A0A915HK75_ROMCU
MMIIPRRARCSCIKKEIDFKFDVLSASLGYNNFIDFKELINPEKGLINKDNVIFQVWITVSEIQMQKLSISEKNAVLAFRVFDCLEKCNDSVVMPSEFLEVVEKFIFTLPKLSSPTLSDCNWYNATKTIIKLKLANPTQFISIMLQYFINLWQFLQRDNYIPKPDAKNVARFKKLLNSAIVDISEKVESSEDEPESNSNNDESSEDECPESTSAQISEQGKSINDSSRQNLELAPPQESASANPAEFRDQDKSGIDSRKRRMENSEIPSKVFRICETTNSNENSPLAVWININSSISQENGQDLKRFIQKCVRDVVENFSLYFIPRFLRTVQISTHQFLVVCLDRFSFDWLRDQISKNKFDNVELSLLTSKMEPQFELMINFSIPTSDDETSD